MTKRKVDPLYRVWGAMKERCENQNNRGYRRYGGRGIKVCERWRSSFENFMMDMGPRPEGQRYTVERVDTNGDYEPSNCRWATYKEQARNKRDNRLITFNGQTKCAAEWEEELGLRRGAVLRRLDQHGWSVEKAITTPRRGPAPEHIRKARQAEHQRKYQATDEYRKRRREYMREWNSRKHG